jgi:hypothetical protein
MLVKELIEQLQRYYTPEDNLIVAYWDKGTIASYAEVKEMTEDDWTQVVEKYENGEFGWQSDATDSFLEIAVEVKNDAS